jgi:hypothetical protein
VAFDGYRAPGGFHVRLPGVLFAGARHLDDGGKYDVTVMYVAETDIEGKVCCVWQKHPGPKAARPVRSFNEVRCCLDEAEYAGASPPAIRAFLMALEVTPDRGTTADRHAATKAS